MPTMHPSALREPGGPLLKIDPTRFAQHFNQRHFIVEHRLKDHPLFTLPRLLELAKEVANKWPDDLYYDRGVTNVGARWEMNNAFPVDETIRNIESTAEISGWTPLPLSCAAHSSRPGFRQ